MDPGLACSTIVDMGWPPEFTPFRISSAKRPMQRMLQKLAQVKRVC